MAALEQVYSCLSCGQHNKVERKPDNSGWIKYNLDGTNYIDVKRSTKQHQSSGPQSATTVADNGLQIAALAEQVKELKEIVNILISQIQMLRSDVTKKLSYLSLSSARVAATYTNSKSKAVGLNTATTTAGCSRISVGVTIGVSIAICSTNCLYFLDCCW